MMHEHGKSAPAVVAVKPTNKAGRPAMEPVEPRAGTKGNAGQQNARRAQDRESAMAIFSALREHRNQFGYWTFSASLFLPAPIEARNVAQRQPYESPARRGGPVPKHPLLRPISIAVAR